MTWQQYPIRQPSGRRHQQGLVAIFVTVAFLFLLGIAALAVDVNHALMNKSKLQNAVDASALAAAVVMANGGSRNDAIAAVSETLTTTMQASGNSEFASLLANTDSGSSEYLFITFGTDPEDKTTFVTSESFTSTSDDVYVRVLISHYPIRNFFVRLFSMEKKVSVSAVAGPSSSMGSVCNVVPVAVCAGSFAGTDTGYKPNTIYSLKTSTSDLGPGNFQLLALGGTGADVVRDNLAGNYQDCVSLEDGALRTQPGGAAGPVQEGINTRFGTSKNMDTTQYPPDKYVKEPTVKAVINAGGNVVYADNWYYEDYLDEVGSCDNSTADDSPVTGCRVNGQPNRRMLAVPVVDCSGAKGGVSNDLPVVTLGCFFLLQQVDSVGVDQSVFGEFVQECVVANGSTDNRSSSDGPYKIVLFKDPFSEGS